MGLDMYLTAKRYIWRHREEEVLDSIKNLHLVKPIYRPKQIEYEAAYWRKSNQIHGWFVHNIQNGKDDCSEYGVGLHDLQQLLAVCKKVMIERDLAPELLPTGEGFFFGGTDYDDGYFEDIEYTINTLELIVADDDAKHLDFYYQSSW
jgi:hypothetical protein